MAFGCALAEVVGAVLTCLGVCVGGDKNPLLSLQKGKFGDVRQKIL